VKGNRISRQVGAGTAEAAGYDAQDRLLSQGGVTYQHDDDGFVTKRGADSFRYSARGELLQATVNERTVYYGYDGYGRRVSRVTGAAGAEQRHIYLYGNPDDLFQVTAIRGPDGLLSTMFYDRSGLLIALERAGARYYVATDQVGNPRVVSDAAGQVVKALEYDSFGNLMLDSNPGFDLPIGFAGGLADGLTGLVRFGFRDYDPLTGRWTAKDPSFFNAGQANLYAYVRNDPVGLRDPSGLRPPPTPRPGGEYGKFHGESEKRGRDSVEPKAGKVKKLWRKAIKALCGEEEEEEEPKKPQKPEKPKIQPYKPKNTPTR
jgi:RHS repeat-associated protein